MGKVNIQMDLQEVSLLFNEIAEKCPKLNGKTFVLMQALPKLYPTQGYELVIRTEGENLDKQTLSTIHDIAAKKNMKVEEKETAVMIFRPAPILAHRAKQSES